jgi:hypothetical protein
MYYTEKCQMIHILRRVRRYQREVIRILISKKNTMAKRKVQKDKQRSIKHTHKTEDRVTRTPLKAGCSGRVSSSCPTSDTRRVNLITIVIKLLFADFVNIVLIFEYKADINIILSNITCSHHDIAEKLLISC